jgi:hypothetical protein
MSARVILLCIDGFPARHVGPAVTPSLVGLAASGGWAPAGGVAELPASTYPNHATLVTGARPREHGVFPGLDANAGVVPASARRVHVPTVLQTARAAGVCTRSVVGDYLLVDVLALAEGGDVWPPSADVVDELPADSTCAHGYLRDRVVLPHVLEAAASDVQLVFAQLNESDTVGHTLGPDSAAALERYREVDGAVGAVLDALAVRWRETVVIVVSDHDMETRTGADPIDPAAALDGTIRAIAPDGGAAWLWAKSDPRGVAAAVAALEGVESCEVFADDLLLATARPGRMFAAPLQPAHGFHGGPSTLATLAVVGGGHPAALELGARVARGAPPLSSWAGVVAGLLEL